MKLITIEMRGMQLMTDYDEHNNVLEELAIEVLGEKEYKNEMLQEVEHRAHVEERQDIIKVLEEDFTKHGIDISTAHLLQLRSGMMETHWVVKGEAREKIKLRLDVIDEILAYRKYHN